MICDYAFPLFSNKYIYLFLCYPQNLMELYLLYEIINYLIIKTKKNSNKKFSFQFQTYHQDYQFNYSKIIFI